MQDNLASDGLPFLKMHGAGNHFVIIDSRGRTGVTTPALAKAIADIHTGVGFDQLAEIGQDGDAVTLTFWNADGSQAGACGNATRCVAHLLMDESGADNVLLRTARGDLFAERRGDAIWVNMGAPQLDWRDVPLSRDVDLLHLPLPGDPVAVGMGNPHCVQFVDDIAAIDVSAEGCAREHDPLFPDATNVEYAEVTGRDRVRMRVWERGTGITLACGSGACATAVAAHQRGLTGRKVLLDVDGGILEVDWRDDGVWLTGPVALVFEGVLSADFLAGAE